ncbi:MAG TPA: efflux RND transporter periplasmic adaptor subunit, partial [Caulobacteraceae bacterium]|nr:efflux RND transporter periplasmic adaptor subunit [Caulobacteraceae bacterium]
MNSFARAAGTVLLMTAVLAGCGKKNEPAGAQAKTPSAASARLVRVVRVEPRTITGGMEAPGVLVSREEAAVAPEVTGYRVARVMVDVGSRVKAGEPVVQLDDTLLKSQIDQQSALLAQAEVAAKQAESQAERVRGLDNQGVLSEEQIEQRRFQAQSARAQANAQAASLRDLKTRQAKMTVRAPVSGLVFERNVRPGDLSGTGGQPMFRIIRDDRVELEAQVAEGLIPNIHIGQPVQVSLPSGRVLQGTVRLIQPIVDAQTKLGRIRVALPVDRELRPGGYGRASFGASTASAQTVPEAALRYDADGVTVMVVDPDNRVHKAPVRVGRRGGGFVELIQGPPAGSRVLLGAASFVLEGDVVKPEEVTVTPTAPPPHSAAAAAVAA